MFNPTICEIGTGDLQLTFAKDFFKALHKFGKCAFRAAHLDVIDVVCAYEVNLSPSFPLV